MINIRGNTYSRNHTHLDPCSSCKEFWSFGLEEGALLDYPAVIDYIAAATGYEDMHFVGYSMGTTQYLMLLSEMPGKLFDHELRHSMQCDGFITCYLRSNRFFSHVLSDGSC